MRTLDILFALLLTLTLCACASQRVPDPAMPVATLEQAASAADPASQVPALSVQEVSLRSGGSRLPVGSVEMVRFSDYVTSCAELHLGPPEWDELSALLNTVPEADAQTPHDGAYLGTRLQIDFTPDVGEGPYTIRLDPISDGRVNWIGPQEETHVLFSPELVQWIQSATGWGIPSVERIAAMQSAFCLGTASRPQEAQTVDPQIVKQLRALAVEANAIPSDGLSDPVYLTISLTDGSTLRAAVDACCGNLFALENQVYQAPENFYLYDIATGSLLPV